jgi:toxin ParE1/3/4
VALEVKLLRLAEILSFVAADNPNAAAWLLDSFESKLPLLTTSPVMGVNPSEKSLSELGYRYLVLDNYLVFYVVEEQAVVVHRIIYGARDYKRVL